MKLLPEIPLIINSPIGAVSLEVPVGTTVKYSKAKYWNNADMIYAVNGGKRYVPLLLSVDGESIVNLKDGAENGIEVVEGEAIEMSLIGDVAKYGFIMRGSLDISDTIKVSGSYTLYPSVYYRDNMIRTFAYQTKEVHVSNSGTLITEVGRDNIEDLLSLKVSGELNGTDILAIWKMKNLKLLDMSGASIVNGGATYYENYSTSEKTIGEYFFKDKDNLIKIVLPINTEYIKRDAFVGCKRLKTLLFPPNVKQDGFYNEGQLYGCDSLESATILCPVAPNWFSDMYGRGTKSLRRVLFGNGVKKIPSYAFFKCTYLEQVSFPNGDIEVGFGAFSHCHNLRSVNIPEGVTAIELDLFNECKKLKDIILPSSITIIGKNAFQSCINLETINLPDGLTRIEEGAVSACGSLRTITIPSSVTYIGNHAFGRCELIQSLKIPQGVQLIEASSFAGCISLNQIYLPTEITTIGAGAFELCYSLPTIDIPNNVTSMGYGVFRNCERLSSITIPSLVTNIGNEAFKGCVKLRSIYSLNETPPIIEVNTFETYHYRNSTLSVPQNSIALYWLHPYWEYFFNVIDNNSSNIDNIDIDTNTESKGNHCNYGNHFYNLNGTKVDASSLRKGIYIKNGKKVIIK